MQNLTFEEALEVYSTALVSCFFIKLHDDCRNLVGRLPGFTQQPNYSSPPTPTFFVEC